MNPFRTGKLVLFQVTYDRDWHFFEIIFFVILGVFGVRNNHIRLSNLDLVLKSGPIWCIRSQIQSTGCSLPSQASRQSWCCRSCHPGNYDCDGWVLQSLYED